MTTDDAGREQREADAARRLYRRLPEDGPPAWLDQSIRAQAREAATAPVPARPRHDPVAGGGPGWWSGWLPWAGSIAAGLVAVFVLLHEPLPMIDGDGSAPRGPAPSASAVPADSVAKSTATERRDATAPATAPIEPLRESTSPPEPARPEAIRQNAASAPASPTDSRGDPPAAGSASSPIPKPSKRETPEAGARSTPPPGSNGANAAAADRSTGTLPAKPDDRHGMPPRPAADGSAPFSQPGQATPATSPPQPPPSPVQRHREALQATPVRPDAKATETGRGEPAPGMPATDAAGAASGVAPSDSALDRGGSPPASTSPDLAGPIRENPVGPSVDAGPPARAAGPTPRAARRADIAPRPDDPPNPAACERRVEVLLRDLRQHDAWMLYKRCRELFPEHEFPAALRRELPKGPTPEFR